MSRLPYRAAKRLIDVTASAAGLIATAPITIPVALAIRATMGSPVLFRQERPGLGGAPFKLNKFRTMRDLRPDESMLASDADRITALGKFLRSTSIDELPSLLNVLSGDMSLVGPRPLQMRYLKRYSPEQGRRHEVKPGVTGWAQINGRNSLTWEEKFDLDVWYVENRSLWLDLKILAMTVWAVASRRGVSAEGEATMSKFTGTENQAGEQGK